MGFFNFLKKFSAKEEVEVKNLRLSEINDWLDSLAKEANIDLKVSNIRKDINEEKERLKENIQNLKDAELKKVNLPERAVNLLQGNKATYVQKITSFVNEFNFPEDKSEILEFCNSFDEVLNTFGKNTIKNYQIIQQFFGEKTSKISENIVQLDNLIKSMKQTI